MNIKQLKEVLGSELVYNRDENTYSVNGKFLVVDPETGEIIVPLKKRTFKEYMYPQENMKIIHEKNTVKYKIKQVVKRCLGSRGKNIGILKSNVTYKVVNNKTGEVLSMRTVKE